MLIYVASPYTDQDPNIRDARYRAVCKQVAEMLRCGIQTFSPICHSHPLVEYGVPGDWAFWRDYDLKFLAMCDEVWVLMLDGWRESKGVQAEIAKALELGKRVVYVEADDVIRGAINDQTPAVAGAVNSGGACDVTG